MLRRLFLPTTSGLYQKADHEYRTTHAPTIQTLKDELRTIQEVIESVRGDRSFFTSNLKEVLSLSTESRTARERDPNCQKHARVLSRQSTLVSEPQNNSEKTLAFTNSLVDDLCGAIKEVDLLRSYSDGLENSVKQYEYLVNTQAAADQTGYRELRDWAQDMLRRFEYLNNILVSVSTVGAGLVYATIFSASRGNIGLMALTFPFFTIGFLVPITFHVALKWASVLPNPVSFASQKFWTCIINGFMMFASLATLAAIVILNITVFLLGPVSSALDHSGVSSATWDNAISITGILAFSAAGSVFLVFLIALVLAITVRGFEAVWNTKKLNALDHFRHV